MNDVKASVVIPVYNQFESLRKVLMGFSMQTLSKRYFELVIVDDGSIDGLKKMNGDEIMKSYGLQSIVIHQDNGGRAKARNVGINEANSNIVIFCDGDRVPKQNFVEQHINFHLNKESIVIGSSYDYFGKIASITDSEINWNDVFQYSRLPSYFKKITSIYDAEGKTFSCLAWLSFLVGNSSISKKLLSIVGGFNESIIEWGFEHFDLALRLQEMDYQFTLNTNASNYHIPHSRPSNFYDEMINKNLILLSKMYKHVNCSVVDKLLKNNIEIVEAEEKIFHN